MLPSVTAETDGPRKPAIDSTGELPPLSFDDADEAPDDLAGYIREYAADGHPVAEVIDAVCAECNGATFRVLAGEDCAVRLCTFCGNEHYLLDSADVWDSAEPAECECPCGGEEFSVAAGFGRNDGGDIDWAYIGLRCLRDGAHGVYADWKIDYAPAEHLLGLV
jgi:hypothetical protein